MVEREQRRQQLEKLAQEASGQTTLEMIYRTSLLKDDDSGIISIRPSSVAANDMIERILEIEFPRGRAKA